MVTLHNDYIITIDAACLWIMKIDKKLVIGATPSDAPIVAFLR